jgi:hypothetical protein
VLGDHDAVGECLQRKGGERLAFDHCEHLTRFHRVADLCAHFASDSREAGSDVGQAVLVRAHLCGEAHAPLDPAGAGRGHLDPELAQDLRIEAHYPLCVDLF